MISLRQKVKRILKFQTSRTRRHMDLRFREKFQKISISRIITQNAGKKRGDSFRFSISRTFIFLFPLKFSFFSLKLEISELSPNKFWKSFSGGP